MVQGHLTLVGMMGTGKSTVGRALAERLGRPLLDSDDEIERRTGRTVREIFEHQGEPAFRVLESEVLAEALARSEPVVIAAAGGVVLDAGNRLALTRHSTVAWLRAPLSVLADRVVRAEHRPLLDHDPEASLASLGRRRRPLYDVVADVVVDNDRRPPAEVASELLAAVERHQRSPERVVVPVVLPDERGYDVVVGRGVRHELATVLPERSRRVAVVTERAIPWGVDPRREHEVFHLEGGEQAKRLASVEDLCRAFARWGLTRADAVVALGGGMVTDVAGFAAAVYHRGVDVVHVPTTLLGQVDAAIGGKTGVNLPEGKNLVGAFWQPRAVLCDQETLVSLPERELRSGMGELAKYHFLGGGELDVLPLTDRVARSAAIKAEVVSGDEREGGRRAILNYGHTLAHALETAGRYDLRHGEAVAVGLVYAAELARRLGRVDDDRVAEHRRVVGAYGLPDRLPEGVDADELLTLMHRDKKAVDGLTFVLDGPDGVEVVRGVEPGVAREVLEAVR